MSKFQFVACFLLVACFMLRGAESQATAAKQQDVDRVVALPGQPLVGFNLFSGNVTVNAAEGRDLFYVFAQCATGTTRIKPLVLWLNGGTLFIYVQALRKSTLIATLYKSWL